MANRIELLTHSRQACFKECRRKHLYAYQLGLRPITDSRALRMGSAFHAGIEELARRPNRVDDSNPHAAMAEVIDNSTAINRACLAVRSHYDVMPSHYDPFDWEIECETVLRLVCAYEWRWAGSKLEYIATELPFEIPLINPATGKATPLFNLAGKIDAIVRLDDGRIAIKETKTMGEDIGTDAPVWRRLRMDQQISLYIHAARQLGYQADTVLYDVIRKPSIAPAPVPVLDGSGIKIVLDEFGNRVQNKNKTWRQTGSVEDRYTVQTRPMTTDEWGDKLTNDITERPDFYFRRVEIPRLDSDVDEFLSELWEIQAAIRDAQKTGRHYRTVSRNTCSFCSYFSICSEGKQIDITNPPVGFEFLSDPNPELQRSLNGNRLTAAPNRSTETAAAYTVKTIA